MAAAAVVVVLALAVAVVVVMVVVAVVVGAVSATGGWAGGEVLRPDTADGAGRAEPLMSLAEERVTLRGGMNK